MEEGKWPDGPINERFRAKKAAEVPSPVAGQWQ
jgi:hypothetical protein